ncbi:MAG: DUF308 domain-containing protein [Mogibacterium sp.]|nr:DUF308 domain-containing protein [Mogibacterium sp.]
MTRTKRIINIIEALVMLALAIYLAMFPTSSLPLVLGIIALGMTVKGIRALMYYFSMAKHMVGGKTVLYRGIILLDIGILTSSLADAPDRSLVIYITAVCIFTGLVAVLRAREEKTGGSRRWIWKLIYGVVYILVAALVLYGGFVWKLPEIAVDAYALGLILSAAGKIGSAFRRTAIVYIQ